MLNIPENFLSITKFCNLI